MKENDSLKVIIDYHNINDYLHNIPPYLFVDGAEVIPGKSAIGYKNTSINEWYFSCHFPGDPIMPGVFQLETIMETASLCIFTLEGHKNIKLYVNELTKVKVLRAVRPGDRLEIQAEIKSFRRGVALAQGMVSANGVKTCEAEFTLISPEIIAKYQVRKKDDA